MHPRHLPRAPLALLLAAACSAPEPGADIAGVGSGTLAPTSPPVLVAVELRAVGLGCRGKQLRQGR